MLRPMHLQKLDRGKNAMSFQKVCHNRYFLSPNHLVIIHIKKGSLKLQSFHYAAGLEKSQTHIGDP